MSNILFYALSLGALAIHGSSCGDGLRFFQSFKVLQWGQSQLCNWNRASRQIGLWTFQEPSHSKGRNECIRKNKTGRCELSFYQDPLIMKWKEKVSKGLGRNRDHQGWGWGVLHSGKEILANYTKASAEGWQKKQFVAGHICRDNWQDLLEEDTNWEEQRISTPLVCPGAMNLDVIAQPPACLRPMAVTSSPYCCWWRLWGCTFGGPSLPVFLTFFYFLYLLLSLPHVMGSSDLPHKPKCATSFLKTRLCF